MTDKERIEVYVNKLPETPDECPCYQDTFCNLHCINEYGKNPNYNAKNCFDMGDCPLKTIQSIQNQKAVEALQKVKKFYDKHLYCSFKENGEYSYHEYTSLENLYENIINLIKEYGGKDE